MKVSSGYGESCAVSMVETEGYRFCSGCVRQWIPPEDGVILGFYVPVGPRLWSAFNS